MRPPRDRRTELHLIKPNSWRKKVENFGVTLPVAVVIACPKLAGLEDADKIQTGIEYLRDHDKEAAIIKADRTIANRAWNTVQLE